MFLVKHSIFQSFTSNIDCIFNFSLKWLVLARFNRKRRETEKKQWPNMPDNFRCLISNVSGLIFQATPLHTALDAFQNVLQSLQWQPAQELIALSGLYCASHGKQDKKAGTLGTRLCQRQCFQDSIQLPEVWKLSFSSCLPLPPPLTTPVIRSFTCSGIMANEAKSSKKHSTLAYN